MTMIYYLAVPGLMVLVFLFGYVAGRIDGMRSDK